MVYVVMDAALVSRPSSTRWSMTILINGGEEEGEEQITQTINGGKEEGEDGGGIKRITPITTEEMK